MAPAPRLNPYALQTLHQTIAVTADARYGWDGAWGSSWSNHPRLSLCTIFLSQTTDVIFNGTTTEFDDLAAQAAGSTR